MTNHTVRSYLRCRAVTKPLAIFIAAALASVPLTAQDKGCEVPTLVSTGGAAPRNSHTLAIRWTGYSNFELAYGGEIMLLDAYFDRGSMFAPLGFKAADVKKANVILIGHGHFDHMSDAASVAARTGAVVVGAPLTVAKLQTQNLDAKQIRTVTGKGGEVLKLGKFEVEPILGRHGQPPANVTRAFNQALQSTATPLTPEQTAEEAVIRSRGTSDPKIVTEGTITYLITLDNGFRILYRDSGGAITEYEKAAMQRIGRVDIAIAAVAADFLPSLTVEQGLEYLRLYKPDVYFPAHYDAPLNGLWRTTEPIFQAMKDEKPSLLTYSRQYREPVCFDTTKKTK